MEFRPLKGDKVAATYYDKQFGKRTIQAVGRLKLISPLRSEGPPNPATGTIKEAGLRAYIIYVADIKKAWTFEVTRGWKRIPRNWTPAASDRVKVTYRKVPSRFTGKTVYQIMTL